MSIIKQLPYEWQVGVRYTRAGKRSGRNSFISFISMISVAGIALGVTVGQNVTLMLEREPRAGDSLNSMVMPRMRALKVAGIFEAGHNELDGSLAFVNMQDAQQLLQLDGPSGLRLRLHDMNQAPQVARELKASMPGQLWMRDWSRASASWYALVQSQKNMMFIILSMIIAVAAFNLVSTLVMSVTDKQADIAILRTLGASPFSIMKIFMIQGALVGILGTLLGVGGGVLVAMNIDVIVPFIEHLLGVQFLSKDIYFISTVPSDLRWPDVTKIGVLAVILAFLATLYPSWWAARVKPAEALRYE